MLTLDLVDFYRGVERMYGRVMTNPDGRRCPYCKERAQMTYIEGSARMTSEKGFRVEAAYQCYVCGRFVIGGALYLGLERRETPWVQTKFIGPQSTPEELFNALKGEEEYWEPISPVGKSFDFDLGEIAGPADEAHRCYSIGAHRAAILLARSVIEATAKKHKITDGQLFQKIEAMGAKGVIRKQTVTAAHGVRDVGNDMAHGDFATADVTADDASDVLILMDVVLNDAFAGDSALDQLKTRRTKAELDE